VINTIRGLAMDAVQKANSGHPGTPMALAPAAYVLWTSFLHHNPSDPQWPDRDRFVLSNGHASMLLYSLLYLCGYGLDLEDLKNFRQWESRTPGHPEHLQTPGVETTTGPLGQGVGNAVGMAITERWLAARFNRPRATIVDHHTWVFCSDGDLMEGVSHEACSLAGHLGLSKLHLIYDDNHITIEGDTALAFSEDVERRFQAYGFYTTAVEDANDLEAIDDAYKRCRTETERPSLIRLRSHIGYGSPHKQDTAEAHGSPLGEEEVRLTKENLGWPTEPLFYVPDAALAHMRESQARGQAWQAEWESRFRAWRGDNPELAAEWDQAMRGDLPPSWDQDLPRWKPEDGGVETRKASSKCIAAIAKRVPWLIGGSADLAPSTNTLMPDAGDYERDTALGRNFHWGVREHGMGAALNGMALHKGVRPYGATFLIFSDYMRPSIRLAALIGTNPIYVFTHDSIGLGEDGPTHQPVEHYSTLRAIPNLWFIRPGDANETAAAWRVAMERQDGPVALALTRQKVPTLPGTAELSAAGVAQGGYVLVAEEGGSPDAILMASGSELQLAVGAVEPLRQAGIRARVVSMACCDLFDRQPPGYRDEVLPPNVRKRVSVEAGVAMSWRQYLGDEGEAISLERFGASAPGEQIFKALGFSVDNVVDTVLRMLRRP
jgi:transketolase